MVRKMKQKFEVWDVVWLWHKKLKAVSRQPLTNFVNLKSNTIMKKPRCKYTGFSFIVNKYIVKYDFFIRNKR